MKNFDWLFLNFVLSTAHIIFWVCCNVVAILSMADIRSVLTVCRNCAVHE